MATQGDSAHFSLLLRLTNMATTSRSTIMSLISLLDGELMIIEVEVRLIKSQFKIKRENPSESSAYLLSIHTHM